MNNLKKWWNFFPGKKKYSKKKKKEVKPTSPSEQQPQSPAPQTEACKVLELGSAECPMFMPQPFMSFYAMFRAMQTGNAVFLEIGQIQLLRLINPLTKTLVATAYAIKHEDGYVWSEVATHKVYYSSDKAFIYEPTNTLEIPLCPTGKDESTIAKCRCDNGDITVLSLFKQAKAAAPEEVTRFDEPLSLDEALKRAQTL